MNSPQGASLDAQARFYQPFGSYKEALTRTSQSVGPGSYNIDNYYKKFRGKACAVRFHKPMLGEENYDMIDYSKIFQPRYKEQKDRMLRSIFYQSHNQVDIQESPKNDLVMQKQNSSNKSYYEQYLSGNLQKHEFLELSYKDRAQKWINKQNEP